MTTIFVNVQEGKIFADSRSTVSYNNLLGKEVIVETKKTKKIDNMFGYGVVIVGDFAVSTWLKSCLYNKKNPKNIPVPASIKKREGGVILTRPGYVVTIFINSGKVVTRTVICSWVASGSGASVGMFKRQYSLNRFMTLDDNNVKKCLSYNSLFDKYSDEEITTISPKQYLRGKK